MAKMTEADFFTLLNVVEMSDAKRRKTVLQARIVGLGMGDMCSRCHGSGHYSFNPVNGTTCFKCLGAGFMAPKLTNKLYAALEPIVASGKLDAYLDEVRARIALTKACKGATDAVMNAWKASEVSKAYDWSLAAQGVEPHKRISNEINAPMCAAYNSTSDATSALESLQFKIKRAETPELRDAIKAEIEVASNNLIKVRDESLAIIADLTEVLQRLQAK